MNRESDKFLPLFGMLLFCVIILADLFANRLIVFHLLGKEILVNGGMITFPFTFFILDFITEHYHFETAKRVIIYNLICILFCCFITKFMLSVPSQSKLISDQSFDDVLNPFIRANIAVVVAGSFSYTFNSYILYKLKIFMRGRRLLFRLLIATTIAEFFYSIIWASVDLGYILAVPQIAQIAGVNLLIKVFFQMITYFPTRIIVGILSRYDRLKEKEFSFVKNA
jgi:uncharacterized integral membrane protein (TIGR00697 family)